MNGSRFHRSILAAAVSAVLLLAPSLRAEEQAQTPDPTPPAPPVETPSDMLGQIEMLRPIVMLSFDESQIRTMIAKIEAIVKRRDDGKLREDALLVDAKDTLQKTRDAVAAGLTPSKEVEAVLAAKRKNIADVRAANQTAFDSDVWDCVDKLHEGQLRRIARSPEAVSYASKIVSRVRGASDVAWDEVLSSLTNEIVGIHIAEMRASWEPKVAELTGEDRENALRDMETQHETEIAGIRDNVEKLLISVRGANSNVLTIAVDKVAVAVRPMSQVRQDAYSIIRRILDDVDSQGALKARLKVLEAADAKSASPTK